jgi:hypothetical protein
MPYYPPSAGLPLTGTGATVTADAPLLNLSQTWNNSGVAFTGWKLNVTNTASAATSLPLDIQVGGSSVFSIRRDGLVTIPTAGSMLIATGVALNYSQAGDVISRSTGRIGFVASTDPTAAAETYWTRSASGVLLSSGAVAATTYLATAAPATQSGTTYTVATTDYALIFTNAGTCTVTLPAAASFSGRHLRVKTTGGGSVISASSNVVPRAGGAAGTAILAATAGSWAELISDGTNWIIMAGA